MAQKKRGVKKTSKKTTIKISTRGSKRRVAVSKKLKKKNLGKKTASRRRLTGKKSSLLGKFEKNPIIAPRADRSWESKATFNPGAIYDEGKVRLLYRAIGDDDSSVLGYAASADGLHIDERGEFPAYNPTLASAREETHAPQPFFYASGGGWNGGCEDPRVTVLGERVYLLYTAFDGWGSVRIALTSINRTDFLKKRWQWKKPAMISPAGEIHKNWAMFPEKINGRFAILHSISPEVLVDYFDDLSELEKEERVIESAHERGERKGVWDSWVRGVGPPPLKTKEGWLVLYHAMDDRDPNRYKLGAMILDLQDPTKILYRSAAPILEPDEYYENQGYKAGVVYSCGAAIIGDDLFVYYGGADAVSCVAKTNLHEFLDELKRTGKPRMKQVAASVRRYV